MTHRTSSERFSDDEHRNPPQKDVSVIKDGVEVAHIHTGDDWQTLKSAVDNIEEASGNTRSLDDEDREYLELILPSLRLMKKEGLDEGYLVKAEVLLTM